LWPWDWLSIWQKWYQEYFLRSKGGRCVGLTLPPWNLGASTSWNPQGLARPILRLLYLLQIGLTLVSYFLTVFVLCLCNVFVWVTDIGHRESYWHWLSSTVFVFYCGSEILMTPVSVVVSQSIPLLGPPCMSLSSSWFCLHFHELMHMWVTLCPSTFGRLTSLSITVHIMPDLMFSTGPVILTEHVSCTDCAVSGILLMFAMWHYG
jgi:hypothetical protein